MADYTKKFLDITGLTQLVKEIKNRIEAAQTASAIDSMSYDAASRKLSIAQGGKNDVANATLPLASSSNAGLMSTDQVAELARLNTAKLDKVALRIDGTTHATLFDTTTTDNGTVVSVVDYTTNVGQDAPTNQAPVASAVATALGTKLDSADFTAFHNEKDGNGVYDLKMASVDGLINDLTDNKLDKTTYNTDKQAIEKSITDGLATKVDDTVYQAHLTAQSETNLAQQEAIKKHEAFLYNGNETNIYTKTQVDAAIDDAIDDAKKAILIGEAEGEIAKAYDTIKEIADWISSNDSADDAAGLTKDVAALKSTTSGHTTAIEGLQASVKDILGEGGKVAALASRLDTVESDLNTESTGIKARLATAEGKISTLEGKVSTAEGKISTLEGKMTTAEGNITTLQGDVTTLTNNKADKSAAFGSVAEDLVWDDAKKSYKLEFTSVSGASVGTAYFPVFTADDITELFNA